MGNDGGSIPTRRELVKEAARNPTASQIKETQQEQQEYLWTTDPITNQPLVQPVVSDAYGNLYNKATILEYLLEEARSDEVKRVSRDSIKSLKDVVELKFEVHPDHQKAGEREVWTCPMTGVKIGPGAKARYLIPCGHVFAYLGFRLLGEECTSCDTPYALPDVTPILSTVDSEIEQMHQRVKNLQKKKLTHSGQKPSASKKRKKAGTDVANGSTTTKPSEQSSSINNASTASLTAKVLQAQDGAKKRKVDSNNVKSLFTNKDKDASKGQNNDFMTRGFSVPTASK